MKLILDESFEELAGVLESWREPKYRCTQIWEGLYKHLWNSPAQFTNLSKHLRYCLEATYSFDSLKVLRHYSSSDGSTNKILFGLSDGREIETVLMVYKKRRTVCVSTQVGCAMGCVFCATGKMGFHRHLSSGEIINQILFFERYLRDGGEKLTNVVIMGMGEPFHNYENTMKAIERLNDVRGFKFGSRRFTLSTVGVIPKIIQFTREKRQENLAISLHAAENSLRSSLLPIAKIYPLTQLMDVCKKYVYETGRRISFEWAMINGKNDSEQDALLLVHLLRGINCHVNIIPLNMVNNYPGEPSSKKQMEIFKNILVKNGVPCTIRLHRGIDIGAGCGQLFSNGNLL